MTRLFHLSARALFTAVSLFAALYCVIAWVPFTWHQVIEGRLLPFLDPVIRCYPLIYAGAAAVLVAVLRPHLAARGWAGRLALVLIATVTLSSAAMFRWPVLSGLRNDSTTLLWGLAALLPLALLAATDIAFFVRTIRWSSTPERQTGSLFCSAILASLFVTGLWASIAWSLQSSVMEWHGFAKLMGVAALSNLTLFLLAFLALDWICAAAANFRNPAAMEFWLCHFCFGTALWLYLQTVVARTMGITGWAAWGIPAALAFTITALHAGIALLLACSMEASGLGVAFRSARGPGANWKVTAFLIAILAVGISAAVRGLAGMDWNYLLQTTLAVFFWPAAFILIYRLAPLPSVNRWGRALSLVVVLASYRLAAGQLPDEEIERWAGYDASFRLTRNIFAARQEDSSSFYKFLAVNTNIPASTTVRPANIDFAPLARESGQKQPHIFLFVIDSLRRDYLSPYNDRVSFTPEIGDFAKENLVFQKAFTHYGGTGLSEPSIWTGSMMVHKQYVTPFEPMNALQKLVRSEKYRVYLSRDSILHTILRPAADDVELDPSATTMSYEFGATLATLEKELAARPASAPPIFAYTQPQNIHVSVIRREGGGSVDKGDYNGFYAPYASRVRHIDTVFGEFVRFLKAKGLYDDSVIILAADHGDSLGEEGRWGHAYTLFPEIVRIPLLMHVPSWLAQGVKWNRSEVVFSTDITPTLFSLLGHTPASKGSNFGKPLFTCYPDIDQSRDPHYLFASSYAPVYGALSGDGSQFFISDAVNDKDYLFDLRGARPRPESLAPANAAKQKDFIRRGIDSINQLFQFHTSGGEFMSMPSGLMYEPLSKTEERAASGSRSANKQRSVLVFDSNPLHRLLLTRMFARCGCVAETAETVRALVATCHESPFGLVLIDCDSPDVDAYKILAELRNANAGSNAPLIALTSSVSQADRRRRRAAGFDNYLEKPARLDKVQALMARYAPNAATGNAQAITSVDMGRLTETVQLAGRDAAAVREIFAVFLTTTPRMLDEMRRAEEEGSPEALSRAAIALKTSSSAMGLRRMEEICGLVRALAESRAMTGVSALMGELSLAFERASCDLRSAEIDLLAHLTGASGNTADAQQRSGPGRVLLAENNLLIAKFISTSLKSSGLEVICVGDGAAALAAASEKTPDVMLLSASLPHIDGFQLLSRFRLEKSFRSTAVIILSQRHQESDVLRSFELGADDFMSQPLNPLEVAARTQRLLRKR